MFPLSTPKASTYSALIRTSHHSGKADGGMTMIKYVGNVILNGWSRSKEEMKGIISSFHPSEAQEKNIKQRLGLPIRYFTSSCWDWAFHPPKQPIQTVWFFSAARRDLALSKWALKIRRRATHEDTKNQFIRIKISGNSTPTQENSYQNISNQNDKK